MKKALVLICVLALAAMVAPLAAGEEKCSEDAATCLRHMADKLKTRGWVGLELDHTAEGAMVVKKVIGDSPAQAAGFQAGDVLAALDGVAYGEENKAALKAAYAKVIPGHTVTYTVRRGGESIDLPVELAKLPETVMAQWIGHHMLAYHLGEEPEDLATSP